MHYDFPGTFTSGSPFHDSATAQQGTIPVSLQTHGSHWYLGQLGAYVALGGIAFLLVPSEWLLSSRGGQHVDWAGARSPPVSLYLWRWPVPS
jgi:hypothetical protein